MYISRIIISNFRNFNEFDVLLSEKSVIVGENTSGKTNLIHALRLVLDPTLPDSARKLSEKDFWDGLEDPMKMGVEIVVSVELKGFENNGSLLAILQDYLVANGETPTSRITYKFFPIPSTDQKEKIKYAFIVYGGDDEANIFGYQQRQWMPLHVLPALRDAESDLQVWRKSPLRPLLESLEVERERLQGAATKIDEATEEILGLDEIKQLSEQIETRLEGMAGAFHSVSPSLGIAPTDALRLLRSLRLFVDGLTQRQIGETSLGICNVLYLTLLILELERKESAGERAATILVIEEPEAHLHPHLQRLVYRDFLQREAGVILTTHSPNIVSVSPVNSIVLLKNHGPAKGTLGSSTATANLSEMEIQDIGRYLDSTRGEMLFSRGVVLVEGDAERHIIPAFADELIGSLDEYGISVCSVQGTDFAPYVKLLASNALDVPFVVITDGDPVIEAGKVKYYAGQKRCMNLAEIMKVEVIEEIRTFFDDSEWDKLDEKLFEAGLFVGEWTLEIDLIRETYQEEFLETLKELGSGETQQSRFEKALKGCVSDAAKYPNDAAQYVLARIKDYGKGRFAMRFSHKVKKGAVPEYINEAISFISKTVNPR